MAGGHEENGTIRQQIGELLAGQRAAVDQRNETARILDKVADRLEKLDDKIEERHNENRAANNVLADKVSAVNADVRAEINKVETKLSARIDETKQDLFKTKLKGAAAVLGIGGAGGAGGNQLAKLFTFLSGGGH